MMELYQEYLTLLNETSHTLAQLTETAGQKAAAVRQDDLAQLNEVIKKEQALSLALRGCEQKRLALLSHLELGDLPLTALADRYPPALRPAAKAATETLQRNFTLYRSAADTARNLLELNLHQIDQYLSAAEENSAGPGYGQQFQQSELPPSLRSDFRA